MGTKIFGIIASAAIVVVIAFALLNVGNYHTLLPEPAAEPTEEVAEVDTMVVEAGVAEAGTAVEVADSLSIAEPTNTLQIEQ